MFYELGYTEDDVSVYMVRHDEPVFKVKETAKKDLWVFKQATDIIVDNWVPLRIDFSPGYYYREIDEVMKKTLIRLNTLKAMKRTVERSTIQLVLS